MTDLFDLKNVEDLPEKIRDYVKEKEPKQTLYTMIVELFKIAKRPLTISEIMVGLYRKYNKQIKYNSCSVQMLLFSYKSKNKIKKLNSTFYKYEE